jgi:hypothetical protein
MREKGTIQREDPEDEDSDLEVAWHFKIVSVIIALGVNSPPRNS